LQFKFVAAKRVVWGKHFRGGKSVPADDFSQRLLNFCIDRKQQNNKHVLLASLKFPLIHLIREQSRAVNVYA
jgi:hypothetical protein